MSRSTVMVPETAGNDKIQAQISDMRQRITSFQTLSGCKRCDVAKLLGLKERTLRRWLETGRGLTFGHLIVFQNFLRQQQSKLEAA